MQPIDPAAGSPEELASVRHLIELGYEDPVEIAARNAVIQHAQATQLGQAEDLIKAGKFNESIRLLQRASQAAPESTAFRHLLARALFRARRFNEATAELEWLEFHGVEHPELALIRAKIAMARRRLEEALDHAQYAKCLQDPLPPADLIIGDLNLRRGDLPTAKAAYASAATHSSIAASAYAGLAGVALRRGCFGLAAEHALEAIERDDRLWLAHLRLGLALEKLDRWPEARVAFEAAARLIPAAAGPYVALSRACAAAGDAQAAVEFNQRARQIIRQRRAQRNQRKKS